MGQFIYQTPAIDVDRSKLFFEKSGWTKFILDDQLHYADGKSIFRLNPIPTSRAGMIYRASENEVRPDIFIRMNDTWATACPSGIYTYWESGEQVSFDSADSSILGNNHGLTIESINLQESIRFYTKLGFVPESESVEHGFVSMKHASGFILTLLKSGMCPHSFCNPSLSFFNGKEGNPKVIDLIRKSGIEIYEEVTFFNPDNKVDNLILREPGGFGFFIFND
ncbi:MAG: hypothetical protein KJ941_06585 [Bacteroidetes bacterium]|nr:hypothetical protein [Bacteroidota bacterium]